MKKILTLLMFTAIQSVYSQLPGYVPATGLQGFWPFTGNASDVSGNNHNGTVSNAVPAADRFNAPASAYSFNGSSSYISTTMTGVLGNNARAVSFWAKSTNSTSTMSGVAWGDEQSFPNHGVRYECAFNIMNSGVTIIGADCAVEYAPPVNAYNNAWHHYIFQFAGGGTGRLDQVEVFQDEILLSNIVYTHSPAAVLNTSSNWPVNFGRIPYAIPHYFDGSLDDIGIWSRTLTPCEIHELYTANKTTITVNPATVTICRGQSLVLTANGVNSYTWGNGAQTPSISVNPTVTTVYNLNGTGAAGCMAANSITVTVSECTGVNEFYDENGYLVVYPNPSNGSFTVKTVSDTEIRILNGLGQTIVAKAIPAQSSLEVSDLPSGIYFVTESSGRAWKKLVVNR